MTKTETVFSIDENESESNLQFRRSNKSYSFEQKKAAVELCKYLTYAYIERKLKIPEFTLREWIKNGISEDKRKKESGRKLMLPEIEDETHKFFKAQ